MVAVKICGINTAESIAVACSAGARMVGFVFVPESPRAVRPEQVREWARHIPTGVQSVGLFANADDALIENVCARVRLDFIQLHGDETPARVQAIKSRFKLPIIKAFPISQKDDVTRIDGYLSVIDWILCDAKAPKGANITGGHGIPFDWMILKNKEFPKPWMLSGGLTIDNLRDALTILSPEAVDVSSGVESTRGVKDHQKIRDFCSLAGQK